MKSLVINAAALLINVLFTYHFLNTGNVLLASVSTTGAVFSFLGLFLDVMKGSPNG